MLIQTVDVIPGGQPQGFTTGKTDSTVLHVQGEGTGIISLDVFDAMQLKGHTYQLSFLDSTDETPFSIYDVDEARSIVKWAPSIWLESEENIADFRPVFDGVGIKVINHTITEELSRGWENVSGDTSDYHFSQLVPTPDSEQCACDYELVFGDSTSKFSGYTNSFYVPFQIFNVTRDPGKENPLEI